MTLTRCTDAWGVEHRGDAQDALLWNDVVHAVVTHHNDTATRLDGLLTRSPEMCAALLLKGFALLFKGRRDLQPVVDQQIDAVRAIQLRDGLSDFESRLFEALQAWSADRYDPTDAALARLVEAYPTHLLAVKLQHGFLFLAGRRKRMAETLEAVLPRWNSSDMGYGYVLGCASFAWGERGDFTQAEALGKTAVELAPDDAWGIHAVSHIFEMRDDNVGGAQWLETHRDGYSFCNNFRGHVFWHLALFELALANMERVWELCDGEVRRAWSGDYRDMSNVASLLWRLEVDGYDVGDRWEELGAIAREHHTDHGSAFADAHYALALGRAGHRDALGALIDSIDGHPCAGGQGEIVHRIGKPLCEAMTHYLSGRFEQASVGFEQIRELIPSVGGSNAQRDLFDQIEIHSALCANNHPRATALLQRRLSARPHNTWAQARAH